MHKIAILRTFPDFRNQITTFKSAHHARSSNLICPGSTCPSEANFENYFKLSVIRRRAPRHFPHFPFGATKFMEFHPAQPPQLSTEPAITGHVTTRRGRVLFLFRFAFNPRRRKMCLSPENNPPVTQQGAVFHFSLRKRNNVVLGSGFSPLSLSRFYLRDFFTWLKGGGGGCLPSPQSVTKGTINFSYNGKRVLFRTVL